MAKDPRNRRGLIGRVIGAYCVGRRDAQEGRRLGPDKYGPEKTYNAYVLGWNDERRRMRAENRLEQTAMDLGV